MRVWFDCTALAIGAGFDGAGGVVATTELAGAGGIGADFGSDGVAACTGAGGDSSGLVGLGAGTAAGDSEACLAVFADLSGRTARMMIVAVTRTTTTALGIAQITHC